MTTSLNSRMKIAVPLLFAAALVGSYALSQRRRREGFKKISGRTYVIIGASSGMGRGVAEELGKYKANVVVAARRNDLLEEVAQNVRAAGGNAITVPVDISKEEEVQQVMDAALEGFGRVDVWINAAGVGAMGRFWEIPPEDQARLVDVNLKGIIYGSHIAILQFTKQGKGVLINLGSVDSEVPHAYHATYSATKAGIKYLSLALRQELRLAGHKDIEVVTIEPWATDTPFWPHGANYTGLEQKFLLMDDPRKLVNAILVNSIWPNKVVPVGWKAKISYSLAHLCPSFNEWFTGNVAHKYQMEMPPKAADSEGAIYKPMDEGREVEEGIDERMSGRGI